MRKRHHRIARAAILMTTMLTGLGAGGAASAQQIDEQDPITVVGRRPAYTEAAP